MFEKIRCRQLKNGGSKARLTTGLVKCFLIFALPDPLWPKSAFHEGQTTSSEPPCSGQMPGLFLTGQM